MTPPADDEDNPTVPALELTSIIGGIVADDNVWGSGTSVKKTDDVYVVVAGKGWDSEGMASIPVCFDAGALDGCEYIVLDGVDTSAFELRDDNDEYSSIELKITNDDDSKVQIISATKLLKDNKIEIPLADVKADILKDAAKIIISFRGTGTVKIKDISKAKAKASQSSSSENGGDTKPGDTTTTKPDDTTEPDEDDDKDKGEKPEEPKPDETEEVIYKLDFSGATPPENYSIADGFFKPNEGVQMTGPWSEFSISPKDIGGKDLASANYIKVSFKCSDDAAFGDDNARFMVGAFKNSENEDKTWSDKNLSWTCFFDKDTDGDVPTEFKTVEKEIKWELKYDDKGNYLPLVVLSDISGFKIFDCNFTKGTLTIQSIEFIKK